LEFDAARYFDVYRPSPHMAKPRLDDPSWRTSNWFDFASTMLRHSGNDGVSIINRARIPIMILTLLLALIVYAWAREMLGFC
jgi:hypothetical protein